MTATAMKPTNCTATTHILVPPSGAAYPASKVGSSFPQLHTMMYTPFSSTLLGTCCTLPCVMRVGLAKLHPRLPKVRVFNRALPSLCVFCGVKVVATGFTQQFFCAYVEDRYRVWAWPVVFKPVSGVGDEHHFCLTRARLFLRRCYRLFFRLHSLAPFLLVLLAPHLLTLWAWATTPKTRRTRTTDADFANGDFVPFLRYRVFNPHPLEWTTP